MTTKDIQERIDKRREKAESRHKGFIRSNRPNQKTFTQKHKFLDEK